MPQHRFSRTLFTSVFLVFVQLLFVGTALAEGLDPVANADSAATNFNTPSAPINVLGNDTLGDGAHTVTVTTAPSDGGSTTVNSDNSITFTPAATTEGAVTFTYTLTDADGDFDTAVVTVAVGDKPIEPPTADAGEDQSVDEAALVNLDGSGSGDSDGTIVRYEWEQTSPGTQVVLSDDEAQNPSFTAPRVGPTVKVLVFRLTVTDDENATDTDEVTITVGNTQNDPPTADAIATPADVLQGEQVELSATNVSDVDGDETIATYLWTQSAEDTVQVVLFDPASPSTTFTAPSVAGDAAYNLNFELVVTDNEDASSVPATVAVNVALEAGKKRPTADAGEDQTVVPLTEVQLDGSESRDEDGENGDITDITRFLWEQVEQVPPGPSVVLSDPEIVNPTFTAPAEISVGNQLVFQLTVTDADGFVDTDEVTIGVGENPPLVDAGENQAVEEGATVTLTGTDSDNGTVVKRLWKHIPSPEGPIVVLADPASEDGITTFVTPIVEAGGEITLRFEYQATDDEGLRSTDVMVVVVRDNGITGIDSEYLAIEGVPFFASGGAGTPAPIGFKAPSRGSIVLLRSQDPGETADNTDRPRRMPYGLFDLHVKTEQPVIPGQPGETITVEIQLSSPAPADYVWFKYDEETGWSQYAGATISSDREIVTLTLTDGGQGDSDKEVDGIIRDPSGLGQTSQDVTITGSSGGGGGLGFWAIIGLGLFIRLKKV